MNENMSKCDFKPGDRVIRIAKDNSKRLVIGGVYTIKSCSCDVELEEFPDIIFFKSLFVKYNFNPNRRKVK